jgi:hypothetical protein
MHGNPKERYMDVLLMWPHTAFFFSLDPLTKHDSPQSERVEFDFSGRIIINLSILGLARISSLLSFI